MSEVFFGRRSRRQLLAGAAGAATAVAVVPRGARASDEAKPWMGVLLRRAPAGVGIELVCSRSPAEDAGLRAGDVLVGVDSRPLRRPRDLVTYVRGREPGDVLTVAARREKKQREVSLTLVAHPGEEEVLRRMHVGKPAADLPGLVGVQGKVFDEMKEARGEVVLLEFFAGWCAGCRAQAPQLSAWHRRFAARGLRVMGVTAQEPSEAREVAERWELPYAVGSDEGRGGHRAYRVSGIPALFLIDAEGVVRDARVGYDPSARARTEKRIEKLLDEKA